MMPPRPPIEGTISAIDPALFEPPPPQPEVAIPGHANNGMANNGMANNSPQANQGNAGQPRANHNGHQANHHNPSVQYNAAAPRGGQNNRASQNGIASHPTAVPVGVSHTNGMAQSASVGLRLTFVQAAGKEGLPETILVDFPFVIGRDEALEHGRITVRGNKRFLNLGGVAKVSRSHLEITTSEGRYYLTDLGSRNGTFIFDQQLDALQPTPIDGKTTVRLGRSTHLELEPIV